MNVHKDRFSEFLAAKFGIRNERKALTLKKVVYIVETIVTALILVVVIQRFYLGNFMVPTGSMIPTIVPKDRLFGNMVIYKFSKPQRGDIVVFKEPIQNKVLYTKRMMGLPGEKIKIENERFIADGVQVSDRRYSNLGDASQGELGFDEWVVPKKGDTIKVVPTGKYKDYLEYNQLDVGKIQDELLSNPGEFRNFLPDLEFSVNGVRTGMLLDFIDNKEVLKKIFEGETYETTLKEDYYLVLGDNTDSSLDSRFWGFVAEHRIRGKAMIRFWPLNRVKWINND